MRKLTRKRDGGEVFSKKAAIQERNQKTGDKSCEWETETEPTSGKNDVILKNWGEKSKKLNVSVGRKVVQQDT